ncbi:MAG: phosphoenolpyruvate--protein phosphotransferase [Nitrospinae bacterium]|nr:phosphoenolpyruvate--protein phosphotransferase [Nitrospinota bacterium]
MLRQLLESGEVEDEISRFHASVEASLSEMSDIREATLSEMGGGAARDLTSFENAPSLFIFDTQTRILSDPSMLRDIEAIIRDKKCNAEWAIKTLIEDYQARFARIHDQYFRERLRDIEQALTRIQSHMVHGGEGSRAEFDEPVVLVAHDLNPADTLRLNTSKVVAVVTDMGGKTSHAGILAAPMDIPAVVGLHDFSYQARTGEKLIVDGSAGVVIRNPSQEQFYAYLKKQLKVRYFDEALQAEKSLQAVTQDGARINVRANIESSGDIGSLAEHGAEGVGLYRTEYLYINRATLPNEQEQYEDYRRVAEAVAPYHAIIRTFDLGGDKLPINGGFIDPEPNPALGLRAIRFCLEHPVIFKTQLRAILRASAHGSLKIMYPLITTLEELLAANVMLREAMEELRRDGVPFDEHIPVGIMMETPSCVMIAPELARQCAFFSIGTNDLIQYTMAIDRVNDRVAHLYQPLSPAILRMLKQIITAADGAGIPVSVCGKMAGDPVYALLMIGMGGVRELSMDVHSIPRIKKFIRSVSLEEARRVAHSALDLGTTGEIRRHIVSQVGRLLVDGLSSELIENEP